MEEYGGGCENPHFCGHDKASGNGQPVRKVIESVCNEIEITGDLGQRLETILIYS